MKRTRGAILTSAAALALVLTGVAVTVDAKRPERRFDLVEATIASIQASFRHFVLLRGWWPKSNAAGFSLRRVVSALSAASIDSASKTAEVCRFRNSLR